MKSKILSAPYIVWMILFTLIPLCIVFYYALTDSITGEFTLANLASMGTYLPIFLRSIWLSLFASLICLVIGYPVAYFIAQCKPLTQRFLEMLIMLPMVFVPAVSTFYISQKLGSTGTTLIGDVIESQFKTAYNPNLGAAMSLVLMILIFVCVSIMNRFGETDEEEVMAKV